jgi:arabinofuranan 3-O-arabinosyltransferase
VNESPAASLRAIIVRLEDAFFTERRLKLFGGAILAGYLISIVTLLVLRYWPIDRSGHPYYLDFVWLWVGAHFALARDVGAAFNYTSFSAAQAPLIGATRGEWPYYHWRYPPTLLLLVAPLGFLPYVVAFFTWIVITLCIYLAAIYAIVSRGIAMLIALIFPAAFVNVLCGQTAFLTTGLVGLFLALLNRRRLVSGITLGLLSYKPQYAFLFPVALAAVGQWRVLSGAAAGALTFAALAVVAFGADSWKEFIGSVRHVNSGTLIPYANLDYFNHTAFGTMHWLGAGPTAAWAVHLCFAVTMLVITVLVWNGPASQELKAATLGLSGLVATPYVVGYDLTALAVPAAFLIRDALEHGFLPGERVMLLCCFLATCFVFAFPIGLFIELILLGLVLRRVRVSNERACSGPALSISASRGRGE